MYAGYSTKLCKHAGSKCWDVGNRDFDVKMPNELLWYDRVLRIPNTPGLLVIFCGIWALILCTIQSIFNHKSRWILKHCNSIGFSKFWIQINWLIVLFIFYHTCYHICSHKLTLNKTSQFLTTYESFMFLCVCKNLWNTYLHSVAL